MGYRDKGRLKLAGKPLIEHVIDRLRPQVSHIAINSPHEEEYTRYGYPVFADLYSGGLGPLAGLHSALEHCDSKLVLTLPCDTPLLPADLVERMYATLEKNDADVCTTTDGERMHAVFMLARHSVKPQLEAYLQQGKRKVQDWLGTVRLAIADFSDSPNAFININTPEQLSELEQKL